MTLKKHKMLRFDNGSLGLHQGFVYCGSVPSSLFRDEGSFWIIQDSTKNLFDVCVQLSNTSVQSNLLHVCSVLYEC